MKRIKLWLSIFIIAAMLFSLNACGRVEKLAPPENRTDAMVAGDGRVEIVLAVNDNVTRSFLPAAVSRFNKSSTKYKVVYGDYENESVLEAAIVSGKGPDIFVEEWYNSLPFSDFTYENLLPYLEADRECGVGVYENSLLNALVKNESVYWLPVFYEIVTFTAPERVVDASQRSITMEQAERAAKELGDNCYVFPGWLDKEVILSYIMHFALGKYIDYETGVCDFDSPGFIALLESCNRQVDHTIIDGGLDPEALERISLLKICRIMYVSCLSNKEYTDEPFVSWPDTKAGTGYRYVGFPNEDGNGSMFSPTQLVAVSSASENKEGAWEFISFILSEEIQSSEINYLPVNRRVLESQIQQGLEGKLKAPLGDTYTFVEIEREEADKFLDLLEHMEVVETLDPVIIPIIKDEAQSLFDGARTAQETAEIIQSRVSIYMGEQR